MRREIFAILSDTRDLSLSQRFNLDGLSIPSSIMDSMIHENEGSDTTRWTHKRVSRDCKELVMCANNFAQGKDTTYGAAIGVRALLSGDYELRDSLLGQSIKVEGNYLESILRERSEVLLSARRIISDF